METTFEPMQVKRYKRSLFEVVVAKDTIVLGGVFVDKAAQSVDRIVFFFAIVYEQGSINEENVVKRTSVTTRKW